MKICFDTSVVIDILGRTSWFADSFASYDVAMIQHFEPYVSVSSTTDIVYILHSRCTLTNTQARKALDTLMQMFTLMDNTAGDCRFAFESNMIDYEDALIAYTAKRYDVDLIVTRNKKDFRLSPVPILTPKEFLETFKPDDIDYDTLDLSNYSF